MPAVKAFLSFQNGDADRRRLVDVAESRAFSLSGRLRRMVAMWFSTVMLSASRLGITKVSFFCR
jgi:hypothetical protein